MLLKFVDRVTELRRLEELSREGFYPVLYVYGPEGCGKTRLLKEFIRRVEGREDFITIYVDALEGTDLRRAVLGSDDLVRAASDLLTEYVGGPIGKFLASLISKLVTELSRRLTFRGKHVVIAVDDVSRALGLDSIGVYVKNLLNLLEEIMSTYGASTALVVVTTSEGVSRDEVAKHTYASLAMIWNLMKEPFSELAKQLSPPNQEVVERTWYLTSGNPRMLLEVALGHKWDLNSWLKSIYEDKVKDVKLRLGKDVTEEITEDPDALLNYPEVAELLIKKNLAIKVSSVTLGEELSPNKELGIGRYYAWQANAYRELMMS